MILKFLSLIFITSLSWGSAVNDGLLHRPILSSDLFNLYCEGRFDDVETATKDIRDSNPSYLPLALMVQADPRKILERINSYDRDIAFEKLSPRDRLIRATAFSWVRDSEMATKLLDFKSDDKILESYRRVTYCNQDRLITYGSKNYTYNSNGDLSHIVYSDATSHEFWFDAFGNIQYIKRRDGSWETYYADGKNRLMAGYLGTSLMHRRIYQDDYRIAARLNDSGVMSENYVYGSHISTPEYVSKGGYRQRVIRDHLGSPRLVVRTLDGVVSQRMDYNEFGEVINDTNPGYQPYGFAGGIYFPSTKMVKFGARFYDASVGRWLSKDPILFGGGDTNLYGYVLNDPVNFVDPQGRSAIGLVLGALCMAYDAYDTYSSMEEVRVYQNQLAALNKKISELDEENDCEKIADLKRQGLELSKKLAKTEALGWAKGLSTAIVCAGLAAF
jgi:RHS repeat-associated protein